MKKYNKINNNNNIAQNPIAIYETTMLLRPLNKNINNNLNGGNIKKYLIDIYENTMMKSNFPDINNKKTHNIIKKKINPIEICETAIMQSNLEGFNNKNQMASSIHF